MRWIVCCLVATVQLGAVDGVPRPVYRPCDLDERSIAFVGFPGAVRSDGKIPIRVETWLAGAGSAEVRLAPSRCAFLPGFKVLVYAAQLGDAVVCREAKPAELAARDLDIFAVLRTGRNFIRGVVKELRPNAPDEPHAGAVVVLEGGRHLARTVTRADGSFELMGLPAGTYYLSADDIGYRAVARWRAVVHVPEFGCASVEPLYLVPYGMRERALEAVDAAADLLNGIRARLGI